MKTINSVIFLALLIFTQSFGQPLSGIYSKGTVRLTEVPGYGIGNKWGELFSDYGTTQNGKETGKLKRIVTAPDGSIFMSHKTRYEIWKFDAKGDFIKKFGSKGSAPGQFGKLPSVEGILDEKYVYTTDGAGQMIFFDLEGKYVKTIKLGYAPYGTVPLGKGKIAIMANIPWKNNQGNRIIVILDFNTEKEKTIWNNIYPYDLKSAISVQYPDGKTMFMIGSTPFYEVYNDPKLVVSKTGSLVALFTSDGKVMEYSPDGEVLHSFSLSFQPLSITQADIDRKVQEIKGHRSAIDDRLRKNTTFKAEDIDLVLKEFDTQLEKIRDVKLYPKTMPYFSDAIVDSDGNLLIFEFTKADVSNKFRVYAYDLSGKYICTAGFESPGYDLSYIQSALTFHQGYIYALANRKEGGSVPLRLVKFKLEN